MRYESPPNPIATTTALNTSPMAHAATGIDSFFLSSWAMTCAGNILADALARIFHSGLEF
jgi:hypothetical protein